MKQITVDYSAACMPKMKRYGIAPAMIYSCERATLTALNVINYSAAHNEYCATDAKQMIIVKPRTRPGLSDDRQYSSIDGIQIDASYYQQYPNYRFIWSQYEKEFLPAGTVKLEEMYAAVKAAAKTSTLQFSGHNEHFNEYVVAPVVRTLRRLGVRGEMELSTIDKHFMPVRLSAETPYSKEISRVDVLLMPMRHKNEDVVDPIPVHNYTTGVPNEMD